MFQIESGEKSSDAVRRIIVEEVAAAIDLLSDSAVNPDTAVHEFRKGIKRIRAVLRLIRPDVGETVFGRENVCFRVASQQLSPLRDSAVMVETLDLIVLHYESTLSPNTFKPIRQQLVTHNEEIQQYFLQRPDIFAGVIETLTEAKHRIENLPITNEGFDLFEEGIKKVYRSGRNRMVEAYKDGDSPEKFHNWRKRVKYLWHHIELLQPLWPAIFVPLAEELHQLSDYLGLSHDLAVLQEFIVANPVIFNTIPNTSDLLALLTNRNQELEMAAQPLGQRLFAESPTAFVSRVALYWTIWQQYGLNDDSYLISRSLSVVA